MLVRRCQVIKRPPGIEVGILASIAMGAHTIHCSGSGSACVGRLRSAAAVTQLGYVSYVGPRARQRLVRVVLLGRCIRISVSLSR